MHVGKNWPRTNINFVQYGIFATNRSPPRKCALRCNTLGNTGTVATQWSGLTVVSTEAERWSTTQQWTRYTFEHPTNADLRIEQRVLYQEDPPVGVGLPSYRYVFHLEAFEVGTLLADWHVSYPYSDFITSGQYNIFIGTTWQHLTNVAKWQNLTCHSGWASWAQQPEYHPYRH